MMLDTLESLAADAVDGDGRALESLVLAVQGKVYHLCLRTLGHPQDAEDAAQEILVQVVTNLGSFRGEAAFGTWMYTIATRHLMRFRARRARRYDLEALAGDLGQPAGTGPEDQLLAEEVFVGCTLAVLTALDRPHRLAFILGAVLEVEHRQAAAMLEITPAAFRKRVSRARARLQEFYAGRCGVFDPEAPCRCANQVPLNIQRKKIDPERLRLCGAGETAADRAGAREKVAEVGALKRVAAMYQAQPEVALPTSFAERLHALVDVRGLGNPSQ